MKCEIPAPNVKVFGRIFHSLSKIGDELYVDPEPNSVTFRAVNSSWSAFACYKFNRSFFSSFDVKHCVDSKGLQTMLKCKISMKSCLGVFKSLVNLEKVVEKCCVTMDDDQSKLIFQLHCKHGIVKTYNLAFIECESLDSAFNKDECANTIVAQSRLLADVASNFRINQDEITLLVQKEKTIFRNYIDDEPDPSKVIRTVLCLDAEEFTEYSIKDEMEITFCLRELRALLMFSEATNLPVHLHFDTSGKPIIFHITNPPTFQVHFVLATLEETSQSLSIENARQDSQSSHLSNEQTANSANIQQNTTTLNNTSIRPTTSKLNASTSDVVLDNNGFPDEPVNTTVTANDGALVDDCVTNSPPPKKKKQDKALFLGMFDSTVLPAVQYTSSQVLAPDSDNED